MMAVLPRRGLRPRPAGGTNDLDFVALLFGDQFGLLEILHHARRGTVGRAASGCAEPLAIIPLLPPRTVTLGALLALGLTYRTLPRKVS